MPTPMPIMAAISGEKFGTTRTWVSSSRSATPIPSPASAVITGRPMATTEPKASSMMRMAAVMPMPSLGPGAAVTAEEIGLPPSSTAKPGVRPRLGHADHLLDRARRDVGRVGGELDLGKGDVAVRGDLVGTGGWRMDPSRCARRAGVAPGPRPNRWPPGCRRWASPCGRRCRPCPPTAPGSAPPGCSAPAVTACCPP